MNRRGRRARREEGMQWMSVRGGEFIKNAGLTKLGLSGPFDPENSYRKVRETRQIDGDAGVMERPRGLLWLSAWSRVPRTGRKWA